jgi:hypothetical protein
MKHGGKMLACMVVGSFALGTVANAITPDATDNPYQSIIDRNVFSLKPAPPPPDPAEANKPQALKITLTGITTILGNKRVLMKTAPPPGKPGEAPKTEQSYILTEGQREGEIEVISIDEKAGSVKVNNAGTVQTLTFEKDGAKLPATQAPPPPGAPPGNNAAPIPGLPLVRPATQSPAAGGTPSFQLPTRVPRVPTANSQASGFTPGVSGVAGTSASQTGFLPGNTTSPTVQSSVGAPSQVAMPSQELSLEEQAIMIEANRMRGAPGASLLPPTVLSPKPGDGAVPQSPVQQNQMLLPTPGRPIPPGPY